MPAEQQQNRTETDCRRVPEAFLTFGLDLGRFSTWCPVPRSIKIVLYIPVRLQFLPSVRCPFLLSHANAIFFYPIPFCFILRIEDPVMFLIRYSGAIFLHFWLHVSGRRPSFLFYSFLLVLFRYTLVIFAMRFGSPGRGRADPARTVDSSFSLCVARDDGENRIGKEKNEEIVVYIYIIFDYYKKEGERQKSKMRIAKGTSFFGLCRLALSRMPLGTTLGVHHIPYIYVLFIFV